MHFVNAQGINLLIIVKVTMEKVPGVIVHAQHMGGEGGDLRLGYGWSLSSALLITRADPVFSGWSFMCTRFTLLHFRVVRMFSDMPRCSSAEQ